ncbi:unnamed protein product [Knipowitschia caucasica]|uniref:Otoancorin n=1 Tax=Knipowitschia caucasica TaxID=637954 RepID=A0AAV2MCX2_KNICA
MERKGGTVFLLVCCAVLVTSLKIKSESQIRQCGRKLMKACMENGHQTLDMDELATALGSDVLTEERDSASSPTSLLSMVEAVLGSISSTDSLSSFDKKRGSKLGNISLAGMIQKMKNVSPTDACAVGAVAAPVAWDTLGNMEKDDMDSEEYLTLLSASKTALKTCHQKLNLPKIIKKSHLTMLMVTLDDVYQESSEKMKGKVAAWYKKKSKETYFNCSSDPSTDSVRCNNSVAWLTCPVLLELGPYLSELSIDDIDHAPNEELCDCFKSPQFKQAIMKMVKMRPSRSVRLYNKIKGCFSDEKELSLNLQSLGPMACHFKPSLQLTSTNSIVVLSALSRCDNPGVTKMKRSLVQSATANMRGNELEVFRQLGREAPVKILSVLKSDDVRSLIKNYSIELSEKQKRFMVKMVLGDKKCGVPSRQDLKDLSRFASLLPNCIIKKMNSSIVDLEVIRNMSGKLKKSQKIALLKTMSEMPVEKMIDYPKLVTILPLHKLRNLKDISWGKATEIEWRISQAMWITQNMIPKYPQWYKIIKNLLPGVVCPMIENVSKSDVPEMAQILADAPQQLSNAQIRCTAQTLFKSLESERPDFFQTITEEEMRNIPSLHLIHLSAEKVKDLPNSVCLVFLDKMEEANLSALPQLSPSRSALTERALKCLGADPSKFTSENMYQLGPLLCEVAPATLRLLSADVLRTSLQYMATCDYIPPMHHEGLVQLLNETIGDSSNWSAADVEDFGHLLLLIEAKFSFSNKPGMKNAVSYLIKTHKNVPEFLKEMLFNWSVTNSFSGARRKREANSNGNGNNKPADSTNTTTVPTVDLITELGAGNVFWTPPQLENMTMDTFTETVTILGAVTGYSPQQLEVLSKKATEAWNSTASMTETEVSALGCIAQGFTDQELMKMAFSLSSLEDIATCGWNSSQITAVWEGAAQHNNLSAETLAASDLVALDRFLCGLSSADIQKLNTGAFTEAVAAMQGLRCSVEVTQQFKSLTLEAFGAPATWTAAEVSDLGNFIIGLNQTEFVSLNVSVFQHISKDIIPLIPPKNFAVLSVEQVLALGPKNAAMITDAQKSSMPKVLQDALTAALKDNAREETLQINNSKAPSLVASVTAPLLVLLVLVLQ